MRLECIARATTGRLKTAADQACDVVANEKVR